MRISIRSLLLIFVLLFITSCDNSAKIVVKDIEIGLFCDTTMFRGIKPDMYYNDLCAIVGEPNEYIDMKSSDEDNHNPLYYFKEGKVMCFWSGNKRDKMGTIVYTPYLNTHLQVDDVIKLPLKDYDINTNTERVSIYKEDTLFFILHVKNLEVKDISYLMIKK